MKVKVSSARWQVAGGERQRVIDRLRWPLAHHTSHITHHSRAAFTLIEVMIALLIFFMAIFTVLGLLSSSLRNARFIQRKTIDSGMVAAQLSLTNKVSEVLEEGDFGDAYPDHRWLSDTYEVGTNGLFEVGIVVERKGGNSPVESRMSILLFRPDSPQGSLSRGSGGTRLQ